MASSINPLALDTQLCFSVYAASHAFGRFYKPRLDAIGLTYAQYLAMMVLWEEDGRTVKGIGEKLFLDSGTLTPLLKRLENSGFITRSRDPEDERQVRVHLTAEGKALKKKAEAIPLQIARATGLAAEEALELKRDMIRLRQQLDDAIKAL